MNKLLMSACLMILIASCNVSKVSNTTNNATGNDEYFKVEVVQNGKILKEKNGIIRLKKEPFKFKLTFYKVKDVQVSNSWGKYYYDYPDDKNIYECNDGSHLKDCRFVAVKTAQDEKFNTDKDIIVGDGHWHSTWFYKEDMDWHRLDRGVKVENGVIYATVTVESIRDMYIGYSNNQVPVEKIDKDIYTVFGASYYESGMETPDELQREKFILRFD